MNIYAKQVRLVWSEIQEPNSECNYTHIVAKTPFGNFLLTWKGWKENPDYGFDETPWGEIAYNGWGNIDEAKQWALQEMNKNISKCYT